MGLLDKALILDKPSIIKEKKKSNFFSPDIDKMIDSLSTITSGLDFSSILFSQLKKELHIYKGALLLPEEELHFVPWAETGFDRTTTSRIRIPQNILESIQNDSDYRIIQLTNSDIEVMSDYFSFREFSVTDSLVLAPLFSEKQLVAILFITEGDILLKSDIEKQNLFRTISEKVGPILFSKRESIFSKMKELDLKEENTENAINSFIERNCKSPFLLLTLSLQNLIDIILKNEKNTVPFRIKQDILRLLQTMLTSKGELISSENNSVILLLKESRVEEAELLIHQIGLSLNYFYKISKNLFKPEYSLKRYPENGNSAEELLKSKN